MMVANVGEMHETATAPTARAADGQGSTSNGVAPSSPGSPGDVTPDSPHSGHSNPSPAVPVVTQAAPDSNVVTSVLSGQLKFQTASRFVLKLRTLLDSKENNEAICWSEDGSCIVIGDTTKFQLMILAKSFKTNNFSSFVRQLNMYGFHKVNGFKHAPEKKSPVVFQHPNFHRDNPELLLNIRRAQTRSSAARAQAGMQAAAHRVAPGRGGKAGPPTVEHARAYGAPYPPQPGRPEGWGKHPHPPYAYVPYPAYDADGASYPPPARVHPDAAVYYRPPVPVGYGYPYYPPPPHAVPVHYEHPPGYAYPYPHPYYVAPPGMAHPSGEYHGPSHSGREGAAPERDSDGPMAALTSAAAYHKGAGEKDAQGSPKLEHAAMLADLAHSNGHKSSPGREERKEAPSNAKREDGEEAGRLWRSF
eukprot:Opistho-1_new@27241